MAHDPQGKAALARERLIGQLRRSNERGATAVAAALAACHPTSPCWSAACPTCGLAFQAAAVSAGEHFLRTPARAIRNRMTALTIVPASGCVPPDELTVEDFRRVGAEILAALEDLRLPATLIGLECTANEDATGAVEPHWCIHGHGLQVDWLSAAQERGLRAAFPASRWVKRPVWCDQLDQRPAGRLYPFKPERVRRVTELKIDDPSRRPYRETKHRELRPGQAVSLAIAEHQLGFRGRLLAHGIDDRALWPHLGAPRAGSGRSVAA